MRKLILLLSMILLANTAFAYDVPKNEEYYKSQIQNQRFLYNATGLSNAVQKNNTEVVNYFMKAGFDPNTSFAGTPMLILAIYKNNPECAKILLDAGANPETSVPPMFVSARSINALTYAINKGTSDVVASLIKNKVDVNKTWNGKTPLNRAIAKKQTKIVELLLNAGAKPDAKTWKMVDKSKDEYLKDLFADIKR